VALIPTRNWDLIAAENDSERFLDSWIRSWKTVTRNQHASSMRTELARGKKHDSGGRALLRRRAVSIIVRASGRTTAVCPARRPQQDKGTRFFFGWAATVFPFRREYHLARSVTSHLPSTCELFLSVARLSLATASRLSPRSSGSHAPGMSPPAHSCQRFVLTFAGRFLFILTPHYVWTFYDLLWLLKLSLCIERGRSAVVSMSIGKCGLRTFAAPDA